MSDSHGGVSAAVALCHADVSPLLVRPLARGGPNGARQEWPGLRPARAAAAGGLGAGRQVWQLEVMLNGHGAYLRSDETQCQRCILLTQCTLTRRSESVTEFSGMQRMGTMSLPSTLLLALSVCVLALQIAPCHSIFSAPFSVRHSSVAPSVGAEVRHRPMRLRGGIEYYENRMDVQDAIQALKQVRKETC